MALTVLPAGPAMATGADPANRIDQQPVAATGMGLDCSRAAYPGGVQINRGTNPDLDFTGMAQSFVPSLGDVTAIDLCLTPVLGGGLFTAPALRALINTLPNGAFTFEVRIHREDGEIGPEDEVSSTTTTLSLADAQADLLQDGAAWFRVDLGETNLSPGTPYLIEFVGPSVSFIWRATCGGNALRAPACNAQSRDAYPEGRARSLGEASDHGFRTIYELEPDLVAGVDAPALVCADVASLDDLVVTVANEGAVSTAPFDVELHLLDDVGSTLIGSARVDGLAAGPSGTVLTVEDLGVTGLPDGASRRVAFEVRVDTGSEITEADRADNVASAASTATGCAPSALGNPDIVARDGAPSPTVEHGTTQLSFLDLPARDIAAGARGFQRVTTSLPGDTSGAEPVLASPAFASPAFASPAFASPAFASPAFASPAFASPAFASSAYASPAFASPAFASPAFASPAFASPAFASPAFASPAFASPAFASNLSVLLGSMSSEQRQQIPLVSVPIRPSWEERLDAHAAANPGGGAADVLALPSQDRTLQDVLGLTPALRVDLNDVDLSRVLPLTLLNVGLANTQLGDFRYDRTPGVGDPCALIESTSHLRCAPLAADGLDPAALTLLELTLLGYDPAAFPLASEPVHGLHDLRVGADGLTGNLLFDTYLANTGHRDLAAAQGVELPTRGHYHLIFTPLGNQSVTEVLTDPASIIACELLASGCTPETTLADVELAYAFRQHAQVSDLVEALNPVGREQFDIGTSLIGLSSLVNLPWQLFDLDPVDLPELVDCPTLPVTVTAESVGETAVVDPRLSVVLPRGWDPVDASFAASIDGGPAVPDAAVLVDEAVQPDGTTVLGVDVTGIVDEQLAVSFDVCASVTLGPWDLRLDDLGWDGFASATDLSVVRRTLSEGGPVDESVTVEVVEATEPDEDSSAASRRIAPNGIVTRHITGATDTDQFVIPIGEDLGDGTVLEEGDVVHVFLGPAPNTLAPDPDTGALVPSGGADLDLALHLSGVSPVVDDLFGPDPDPADAALTDEAAVLPVATARVGQNEVYGSLGASPAFASPAFASPAFASPAFASPAFASPAFASPAFASPARMLSNQRGDAIEHVTTPILPGWTAENRITIEVRGHLGAADVDPYQLWYLVLKGTQEPVVCEPPFGADFAAALGPAQGVPSIDNATESLLLFNRAVWQAQYGSEAAQQLAHSLGLLADNPLVNGVVVDPMDDPAYRAAYLAHVTTDAWCDPQSANRVHGAARSLVLDLADQTSGEDGSTGLTYVVVVGGDDVHPFARVQDTTTLAHEREHLASVARQTGGWNPLLAAHAGGYLLTDDPMVTRNPRVWGADLLWLPDLVSSRLYGDPLDILVQLGAFAATDGIVEIDRAIVSGEDFLADGAFDAAAYLASIGVTVDDRLLHEAGTALDDLSSREDVIAALSDDSDLSLLFQHADQSNLQSALGTAARFGDTVSTSDHDALGLSFGQVVAGTVCHFGLQIPEQYLDPSGFGGPTWGEVLGRRSSTSFLAAHTSYGYGISEGRDLSEELVNLLTRNAMTGASWGEALRRAKVEYFATRSAYGEHQRKAIMTLTGSGLPFVRVADPAPSTGPDVVTSTIGVDPNTGLSTAALSVPTLGVGGPGCTNCLERVSVPSTAGRDGGTYHRAVTGGLGGAQGPEGRPLVPITTTVHDLGGAVVGGVVVTGITSVPAPGRDGELDRVDFVSSTTHVSSTLQEAPSRVLDVVNGGPFANVRQVDGQAWITMPRAAVRGINVEPDGEVTGTYRLDTAMQGTIYLRDPEAPEILAPHLSDLQVTRLTPESGGQDTIGVVLTAEDQSSMPRAVIGLLAGGTWQFRDAAPTSTTNFTSGEGTTFTRQVFTTGFNVPSGAMADSIAMFVVDQWGTVATSERKGQRLDVVPGGAPVLDDPTLDVVGELVGGIYVDEVTVRVDGDPSRTYVLTIDGVMHVVQGGDVRVVTGPGRHTVTAQRTDSPVIATTEFVIDDAAPTVDFRVPDDDADLEGRTFRSFELVPIDVLCDDAVAGVAPNDCVVSPEGTLKGQGTHLDTTTITGDGTRQVTVTATDGVGKVTTATVEYRVVSRWRFVGFSSPVVTDPTTGEQTLEVPEDHHSIPFRFKVKDALTGHHIGDTRLLRFTWTQLASPDPDREVGTSCDAVSKYTFRHMWWWFRFDAKTMCGALDFRDDETWQFSAILPDGLALTADVTFTEADDEPDPDDCWDDSEDEYSSSCEESSD